MVRHRSSQEALGANAVLTMRFDASSMSTFMTEIVAYGTAVVIEAAPNDQPAAPTTPTR